MIVCAFHPDPCSQGLADNTVVARVNGELWDMDRPLEQDCSLHFLRFDDEDAQTVSLPPLDASQGPY